MDSRDWLGALPSGVRRDLLHALTAPEERRAEVIGSMFFRDGTRGLAEVLIELEEDELIRFQVIDLLLELAR